MPLSRKFDPTTPDGQHIAALARRLFALGTDWPSQDVATILNEWFDQTLGIDPEGPEYQVDAVPPRLVSPDATTANVTKLLLNAGPTLHNPHRPDHADDFTVTTDPACCDGECVTVTLPNARAKRARFALAWLRQAAFHAEEQRA
ncbi:hypothetical protein [Streptomyces sp. NPDC055140]